MSEQGGAAEPVSLFEHLADGEVQPTAFARGPWDPGALHGGPVAALLARAVEQLPTLPTDGVDWFVARLTVELERPVPMAPLQVRAEITRPGRKVSIVETTVARADTDQVVARARALRIRTADVPLPIDQPQLAPLLAIEAPPPGPETGRPAIVGPGDEAIAFHNGATEHRYVGAPEGPFVGPAIDWIRLCVPLFPDEVVTPLQRVAAAVDFANGISAVLPWETYLFVNPDLTVHLFRPLRGEWVGMASATHHGDRGIGMSDTSVFDIDGRVGRSSQSLLLEAR